MNALHDSSRASSRPAATRLSRRSFLAAAGGGLLILRSSRTAFSYQANQRVNLAVMGHMYVAGHFFSALHAYPGVELVAICNPDQRRIPEIFQGWQEQAQKGTDSPQAHERQAATGYRRLFDHPPPVFADFRRMLEEQGTGIDALVVSMFDHYHGVACGSAIRAGKHVFCERPLGLTIGDSRALRELARRRGVATSIRNPGNASGAFRRGVELVRQGAIGPVREVHVWFDRGGPDLQQPPQGSPPVPEGLDWDLWLGPAALRPYHPDWMAYAHWREFSNGGIGTFGPHAANMAFMALQLQELWQPPPAGAEQGLIRVRAECPRINRLSFPRWEIVRWEVPARGELPPVTFTWHHGPGLPPGSREQLLQILADHGASRDESERLLGYAGAVLVGSDGILATDDHNVTCNLLPRERFADVQQQRPEQLPASRGHYVDWLQACRGGQPAWANFDYAGPLSEFLMLGNLATQFDQPLQYDPAAGRVVAPEAADRMLEYEYREGWTL